MFKYYISKLGGVGKTCADLADTGGVQNLGKPADVILDRSVKPVFVLNMILFTVWVLNMMLNYCMGIE